MLTKAINSVLEYFHHESTFKGVFALLTAIGVTVAPEHQTAIISAGLSLIGLIQVFVDDRNVDKSSI